MRLPELVPAGFDAFRVVSGAVGGVGDGRGEGVGHSGVESEGAEKYGVSGADAMKERGRCTISVCRRMRRSNASLRFTFVPFPSSRSLSSMRYILLWPALLTLPHSPLSLHSSLPRPIPSRRSLRQTLASVPDADGDGHEDMLIGSADDNVDGAKRAYLFSGATGALLYAFDPPTPRYDSAIRYPACQTPMEWTRRSADRGHSETGPSISGRAYLYSWLPAPSSAHSSRPTVISATPSLDSRSQAYRTQTVTDAAISSSVRLTRTQLPVGCLSVQRCDRHLIHRIQDP